MKMQADDQLEDHVDPRVQGELESLNRATDEINQRETEISEQRSKFKLLLNDATQQLAVYGKKYGKSIAKARSYYETMKEAKKAQCALERAVQNFQKSNGVYRAAKETIWLAEQRLSEFDDHKVDAAWQEMLNMQTMRLMEAEKERSRSQTIHQQAALRHEFLQKKASKMKRRHKSSIARTRTYYEIKEKLEFKLQKQQQCVNDLHDRIKEAKSRYQKALSNLEKISLEIHEQRKIKLLKEEVRAAGEGCEAADQNLVAIAKLANFDLQKQSSYDDIDALEMELGEFKFDEGGSDWENDEESSEDEWSGSSESGERSSTTSSKDERRASYQRFRRQISDVSTTEEPLVASGKPQYRKKKMEPPKQGSLVEEDDVFQENNSGANMTPHDVVRSGHCRSISGDVTYDNLHGVSTISPLKKNVINDDYDIFDDLC